VTVAPRAETATADTAPSDPVETAASAALEATDELVEDELLVEEISIDGMCGVY